MKNATAAVPHRAPSFFLPRAFSAAPLGLLLLLLAVFGQPAQAQSLKLGNALFAAGDDTPTTQDVAKCICSGEKTSFTLRYEGSLGSSVSGSSSTSGAFGPVNRGDTFAISGSSSPGVPIDFTVGGNTVQLSTTCGSAQTQLNKTITVGSAVFRVISVSGVLGGNPITCDLEANMACTSEFAPLLDPSNPAPQQGDQVSFSVPFTNKSSSGDGVASGVLLDAEVTTNFTAGKWTIVSTSGADTIVENEAGGTIVFAFDTFSPGETRTVNFTLEVASGAAGNDLVTVGVTQADLADPKSDCPSSATCNAEECIFPFQNLPVELVAFDAVIDGRSARLEWRTASETNNAGFEVQHRYLEATEKSTRFDALGWIDGHGTTELAQSYSFRVADLKPGRHLFRLKQIDLDGAFEFSPEVEVMVEMPDAFVVNPVYPNPFNPEATFTFAVKQAQQVTVELYDVLGRRVTQLYQGTPATEVLQTVRIDGADLQSGIYFVQVVGERFTKTQTITLLK